MSEGDLNLSVGMAGQGRLQCHSSAKKSSHPQHPAGLHTGSCCRRPAADFSLLLLPRYEHSHPQTPWKLKALWTCRHLCKDSVLQS